MKTTLEAMFQDLTPNKTSHTKHEQAKNTESEIYRKKTFNINLAVWDDIALIASFQGKEFNAIVNDILAAEVERCSELLAKIKQLKNMR